MKSMQDKSFPPAQQKEELNHNKEKHFCIIVETIKLIQEANARTLQIINDVLRRNNNDVHSSSSPLPSHLSSVSKHS